MNEKKSTLDDLLHGARGVRLSEAARTRSRRRLAAAAASLGVASVGSSAGAGVLRRTARWLLGTAGGKTAIVVGVAAWGAMGAQRWGLVRQEAPDAQSEQRESLDYALPARGPAAYSVDVPPDPAQSATEEPPPAPSLPSSSALHITVPRGAFTKTPRTGGLEAEINLLRQAQTDLREGRPEAALVRLDRAPLHASLAEEHAAARITALCRLQRNSEAHRERARFLARFPDSALRRRVTASCPVDAPSPNAPP